MQAFSIDDSATTEIDDALSVQGLGSGTVVFGVHIAAPGLAIAPDSALDKLARERLSTVYMPGWKLTMLPDEVVQAYTLMEGRTCPALSLYVTLDEATLELRGSQTSLEQVPIVANLRHDRLDAVITEASLTGEAPADYAFAPELAFAFRLARTLKARREVVRGKPETFNRPDYNFRLLGDGAEPTGDETVQISTQMCIRDRRRCRPRPTRPPGAGPSAGRTATAPSTARCRSGSGSAASRWPCGGGGGGGGKAVSWQPDTGMAVVMSAGAEDGKRPSLESSAMHIHILGICGTFMGGLAALAREAGHRVTGCDAGVYPPMSEQLRALGIDLIEGFAADQLALKPDLFVIGNVVKRGNPLMEAVLDAGAPYTSGPQWLADHVLQGRHVLAVAGTHGKTTTTAMPVSYTHLDVYKRQTSTTSAPGAR